MFSFTTISPVSMPTYVGLMLGGSSIGSTFSESATDLNSAGDSVNGSTATSATAGAIIAGTGRTYSISGTTTTISYSSTGSSSVATHFAPSTSSTTVGSESGPPSSASYSTTYTLNQTNSGTFEQSGTTSSVEHSADTYSGLSASWGDESDISTAVTNDTVSSGSSTNGTFTTGSYPATSSTNSTSTASTRPSSTARTGSGTSTSEYRETFTYGTASRTATATEPCPRYTTSSWTYDAGTTTSSSWDTETTTVSSAHTVSTADSSTDTLTTEGDSSSYLTESTSAGTDTGTRIASSYPRTTSVFHQLVDSVYRLSDGGSDFLRGYMVWSMPSSVPSANTYTGKFTDLYVPATGPSFTVSDYQKFSTNSLPIPIVSLSRASTTTALTTGTGTDTSTAAGTTITTLTNGNPVYTTTGWTNTYSLGDVSSSASLPTGTNTSTTTVFTHTDFISGYETSGNRSFTTSTSAGFWQATSQSGTRVEWASSYTTTATKQSRLTTSDVVLRSVQTVTSSTGTSSYLSFLGLSRYTTSRIITKEIRVTDTSWSVGITMSNWTSSTVETTSDDTAFANTLATSISGSHNLSLSSSERLLVRTYGSILSPPAYNEAWMTTPARAWAGFCGSFTQTSPAVYLTTTSGLAAGSTFSDANPNIQLGTVGMNENGVSIVPCNRTTGITLAGAGLQSSSLVSVPTGPESVVSIAATWTSTTTYGSSTVTSTRSATHTAAMSSPVTGNFWTAFPITFDSTADIGYNGPNASLGGYVAGNNRMGSHEVRVNAGAVSWTQFTSGASDTTGVTGETSGTDESASFTVPQGAAVRIAVEPIITVSWIPSNIYTSEGDHLIATCPHQPFLYASAP